MNLIAALLDPASVTTLGEREWNDLLILGRRQGLLARLGRQVAGHGLADQIPPKAREIIGAASIAVESSQTAIRFEINRILRALGTAGTPLILLKGAAYVMAGLPPAHGRLVGDLDLMVARDRIDAVERSLVEHGWVPAETTDYDQRYYREWMHEIPPLQHPLRDTPVDIHHTIAPLTARYRPDAKALVAAARPLADARLRVLAPADMILHSAVHLFNDEVGKPLRDLFDLHDLLGHFGPQPGFWDTLLARARLHGLARPLHYALRHTRSLLGTPIPMFVEQGADVPGPLTEALMDTLFGAHFLGCGVKPRPPAVSAARWALYARTHWLRMPPHLLARHLAIKSIHRMRDALRRESADGAA